MRKNEYDDEFEYYEEEDLRRKRRRRGRGPFRLLLLFLILLVCFYNRDRIVPGIRNLRGRIMEYSAEGSGGGMQSGKGGLFENFFSLFGAGNPDGSSAEGERAESGEENTGSGEISGAANDPENAAHSDSADQTENAVSMDGAGSGSEIDAGEGTGQGGAAEEGGSSLDGKLESCYYYRHLSGEDRDIYRTLYAGIMDMQEDITFSMTDYDSIYRTEALMLADHPEIFWYEGGGSYTKYTLRIVLHPEYTMDADERQAREAQIAEETAACMARVGANETTYERLATAFSFVARNCSYEEDSADNQNICSSLINHVSVCAGYARGVQYLLQQMGIECLYVWGRLDERGDHAWLIVNIDGTYYHSDPTFGDRSFIDGSAEEHGLPDALAIEYGYLCMSDADALNDRTISPELSAWTEIPVCDADESSYYHRHGWYYEAYDEEVWSEISRDLSDGQHYWCFQFGSEEAFRRFLSEIEEENRFAKLALEKLGLSKVSVYTSPNPSLRTVAGWIP